MSPYVLSQPNPKPVFSSPDELARHQAENLRRAIGDELWEWLERKEEEVKGGNSEELKRVFY